MRSPNLPAYIYNSNCRGSSIQAQITAGHLDALAQGLVATCGCVDDVIGPKAPDGFSFLGAPGHCYDFCACHMRDLSPRTQSLDELQAVI